MSDFLEDGDLSIDSFQICMVFDFLLLQNFYRYLNYKFKARRIKSGDCRALKETKEFKLPSLLWGRECPASLCQRYLFLWFFLHTKATLC